MSQKQVSLQPTLQAGVSTKKHYMRTEKVNCVLRLRSAYNYKTDILIDGNFI